MTGIWPPPIAGLQSRGRSVRIGVLPLEMGWLCGVQAAAVDGGPVAYAGDGVVGRGHDSQGYPGAGPDLGITCGFGFAVR